MIKIFVVNLKSSPERRLHMERQFEKLKIEGPEFIEAVDGRLLSESYLDSITNQEVSLLFLGRSIANTEVGCYLSHLKIYKKIVDENLPYAIVFEDDVYLNENIKHFVATIQNIPNDLDLVALANYPDTSYFFRSRKLSARFKLKQHVRGIWGTYAYYISNEGAKNLLSQTDKIYMPIDYLGRVFGKSKIKTAVVHPFLVSTAVSQMHQNAAIPSIISSERTHLESATTTSFFSRAKTLIKRFGF